MRHTESASGLVRISGPPMLAIAMLAASAQRSALESRRGTYFRAIGCNNSSATVGKPWDQVRLWWGCVSGGACSLYGGAGGITGQNGA